MAEKYQNKYRIKSARLKNWDYGSNAAYFVTICTHNREDYFGEINNGTMKLSNIGQLANTYWNKIPAHFPFVELGAFVIMPNHVHGIIVIDKLIDDDGTLRGDNGDDNDNHDGNGVHEETLHATSLLSQNDRNKNIAMASISPKKGTLSTIIRSYKSVVTKNARSIDHDFSWQSRFHDHIIRNDRSYRTITDYIINNPLVWNKDKFNRQRIE